MAGFSCPHVSYLHTSEPVLINLPLPLPCHCAHVQQHGVLEGMHWELFAMFSRSWIQEEGCRWNSLFRPQWPDITFLDKWPFIKYSAFPAFRSDGKAHISGSRAISCNWELLLCYLLYLPYCLLQGRIWRRESLEWVDNRHCMQAGAGHFSCPVCGVCSVLSSWKDVLNALEFRKHCSRSSNELSLKRRMQKLTVSTKQSAFRGHTGKEESSPSHLSHRTAHVGVSVLQCSGCILTRSCCQLPEAWLSQRHGFPRGLRIFLVTVGAEGSRVPCQPF